MSSTIERPAAAALTASPPSRLSRLWNRRLDHYPETRARLGHLAIVVAVTVLLYWQLYVDGGAATRILRDLDMSFLYFTGLTAAGAAIGAFASLAAGLADRWGRANLVAYGVALTAVITLVGFPLCDTKLQFAACFGALSFVEGIVLVGTAGLVRDFSPQVGRASAMGFWTLGPVLGSLVVTVVASHTLDRYDTWQSQFVICGIAGAVIAVAAILFLRELSPNLRDQVMVELDDRELLERRASRGEGIAHAGGLRAFGAVAHARVLGPALGVSLALVLYYTLVAFAVVLLATTFGYSESRANGLVSWYWVTCAIALVLTGVLSDKVRVRKPFLVIGGAGFAVLTIMFIGKLTDPGTSYGTLRGLLVGMAAFQSLLYVPWMAAYTETLEDLNPSLVAAGLAVWGWIIRIVICAVFLALPHVVSGVSTLVEAPPPAALQAQGAALKAEQAKLEAHGAKLKIRAATLTEQGNALRARAARAAAAGVTPTPEQLAAGKAAASRLRTAGAELQREAAALRAQGASLQARGTTFKAKVGHLQATAAAVPQRWQTWLWLCVAGQLLFIPLALLLRGRWSPRAAATDLRLHDVEVGTELARTEPAQATA
jgi:MFS family permease